MTKSICIMTYFVLMLLFAPSALGQAVRLEGQVVCCAVREGDRFTLYELEQAKFRLPGKNWLDFVGKRVAVTGTIQKKKNTSVVRVDALEVLTASLAEREAQRVVGQEVELALKDPFGTDQRLSSLKGRIVILNFWADKVLQFVKETKVNFPVWLGATTEHMIRFGLGAALPGTVIINREGRVAKVISGVVNQADLKKQIDAMLATAEKTVATLIVDEGASY